MNATTGRALWRVLHAFAFTYTETPTEDDKRRALEFLGWFDQIVEEASKGACQCGQHWADLRAQYAVRLDSREAFFRWSVGIHNAVNERLGKGCVTL